MLGILGKLLCISGYFGHLVVSVVPSAGISYTRGAGINASDEGGAHSRPGRQQ